MLKAADLPAPISRIRRCDRLDKARSIFFGVADPLGDRAAGHPRGQEGYQQRLQTGWHSVFLAEP